MKKLLALTALVLTTLGAFAQGTAFTYQGRLNSGTNTANGSYDFTFAVFDIASGGVSGSGTITNASVSVSNGLFTTTLDFGNAPDGLPAWLEIGVRSNNPSGGGAFTTLSPRQQILPTPYAMFATTASNLVGNVALAQLPATVLTNGAGGVNLTGAFTGNGAGVTNVNAATLGGLSAGTFWQLGGNNVAPGQFLGSTNNQPLELRVNNQRGLRLDAGGSNSVNVIGGYAGNSIPPGIVGATIGGGGAGNYFGPAKLNSVVSDFGTVAGGADNSIQSFALNSGAYATIAGGGGNSISNASGSTIGGGQQNQIRDGSHSAIGGGFSHITFSAYSTIGGGYNHSISFNSTASTISGGNGNRILPNNPYATISGGRDNTIETDSDHATINGGGQNTMSGYNTYSTIGGGFSNAIGFNTQSATIGGGVGNTIDSFGNYSTIPGGLNNFAGQYAFAAGRRAKASNTGAFVWADSQDADFSSTAANQFLVRAAGGVGINTPNPVVPLTVQGSGVYNAIGAAAIAVKNSTANKTWEWHVLDDGRMQFADLTAGATRMVIDTAGNVTATSFVSTSDRNAKENFAAVSAQEILAKVAALPITRWNFKQDASTPHIGPMAQDFHAAFGTGQDDKHIATVDADGVALAAIQGLNQKLEEQKSENTELKQRLEKLERLMNEKSNGGAK